MSRDIIFERADVCGNDIVVRCVVLQHHPHHLNVVACVAPVALGIEISQRNLQVFMTILLVLFFEQLNSNAPSLAVQA